MVGHVAVRGRVARHPRQAQGTGGGDDEAHQRARRAPDHLPQTGAHAMESIQSPSCRVCQGPAPERGAKGLPRSVGPKACPAAWGQRPAPERGAKGLPNHTASLKVSPTPFLWYAIFGAKSESREFPGGGSCGSSGLLLG
jgi:hypothetical protein